MRLVTKLGVAVCLVVSAWVLAPPVAAQDRGNWMRDHVRQFELSARQRVFDDPVALDSLVRPQIVGGTVAPPERWQFLFGLLNAAIADNFQAQFCAAFLVHPRYALTAAHCVDFLVSPAEIDVLVGTHRLDGSGTRRKVQQIVVHPQWDPETVDYDVALLQLAEPIDGIVPATLPTPTVERIFALPGTAAMTAGWGDMAPGFPIDLHEVVVPIVSQSDCNDENSYDGLITDSMICAGLTEGGKDSCQGDSGGPLAVRGRDGQWTLAAGIVSWGFGCALPDLFGVYARVSAVSQWVNSLIVERIPSGTRLIDCESLPPWVQLACVGGQAGQISLPAVNPFAPAVGGGWPALWPNATQP